MPIDFSGIRRNTLVGRALRVPLQLIPRGAVLRVLQGPARGARWVVGSGNHGCWLGSYEQAKALAFATALQPGMCVYDVGANVGYYTVIAARRIGMDGMVAAFEPLAENLTYLHRHVQVNRPGNVRIFDVAVSDRDGREPFAPGPDRSSGRLAVKGDLTVRTVALDTLVAGGTVRAPDLMKIDVEGAELAVLHGATRVLREVRPVIFLATHGPEVHATCCELLLGSGYDLTSLDGKPLAHADEIVAWPTVSA